MLISNVGKKSKTSSCNRMWLQLHRLKLNSIPKECSYWIGVLAFVLNLWWQFFKSKIQHDSNWVCSIWYYIIQKLVHAQLWPIYSILYALCIRCVQFDLRWNSRHFALGRKFIICYSTILPSMRYTYQAKSESTVFYRGNSEFQRVSDCLNCLCVCAFEYLCLHISSDASDHKRQQQILRNQLNFICNLVVNFATMATIRRKFSSTTTIIILFAMLFTGSHLKFVFSMFHPYCCKVFNCNFCHFLQRNILFLVLQRKKENSIE